MATVSDVTTPPSSGIFTVDAVLDTGPGWNWITPGRNILYYTFSLSPASSSDSDLLIGFGTRFNAAQEAATVTMLSYITQVTGIAFAATSDGDAADLHFVAADIADPGFAGYCSWNWRYTNSGDAVTSYTADAYIYLDNVNYTSQTNVPTFSNYGYELILHEVGHALGLKHSFQGSVTLPPGQDDTAHTLMSYTHVGGPHETYSPYDLDALKWLYGGDGLGGMWGINSVNGPSLSTSDSTPPSVISFNPQDEATGVAVGANIVVSFNETIARGNGTITLRTAAGAVVESYDAYSSANLSVSGAVLTLNPSNDLQAGTAYALDFGAGVVKDLTGNAFAGTSSYNFTTAVGGTTGNTTEGTHGNDTLFGGGGDDTLNGRGGNDRLTGAAGNDYLNGGDGIDTAVFSGMRQGYNLSVDSFGDRTVNHWAGNDGLDTLVSVERLKFSDHSLALDMASYEAGGGAALLIGAVLGANALAAKPDLVGAVIGLMDQGLSLSVLSGAVMRLPVWDLLAGDTRSVSIATYLLTTVNNGLAPDAATLSAAVASLDHDPQGQFLFNLCQSVANQWQVDLVGLSQTGLGYV